MARMLDDLLTAAGMSLGEAATWLHLSPRTLRRYQLEGVVPESVRLALERRQWVSPDACRYLEALAYWRGVEANKRVLGAPGHATGEVVPFPPLSLRHTR